jgi:hypothetical protein
MKRLLLLLGIAVAVSGLVFAARVALPIYMFTRQDPYPAFMADYAAQAPASYRVAEQAFGEFVARTFPAGSDATDAVRRITGGGFRVANSTPTRVELFWNRSSGPCADTYSIVISRNANDEIDAIKGYLNPVCL